MPTTSPSAHADSCGEAGHVVCCLYPGILQRQRLLEAFMLNPRDLLTTGLIGGGRMHCFRGTANYWPKILRIFDGDDDPLVIILERDQSGENRNDAVIGRRYISTIC